MKPFVVSSGFDDIGSLLKLLEGGVLSISNDESLEPVNEEEGKLEPFERNLLLGPENALLSGELDDIYEG